MPKYVQLFESFINSETINEMPRHGRSGGSRYGGPRYGRYGRSSNWVDIQPKDRSRAVELKNGRLGKVDSDPDGGEITVGNAKKMAKLITDTGKLMARMEAIADVYSNPAVIKPFVDRVLELLPSSKYAAAYNLGKKEAEFTNTIGSDSYDTGYADMDVLNSVFADLGLAAPAPTSHGNRSESIMYNAGFDAGSMETATVEADVLPSNGL
jgi:hypothetical protein